MIVVELPDRSRLSLRSLDELSHVPVNLRLARNYGKGKAQCLCTTPGIPLAICRDIVDIHEHYFLRSHPSHGNRHATRCIFGKKLATGKRSTSTTTRTPRPAELASWLHSVWARASFNTHDDSRTSWSRAARPLIAATPPESGLITLIIPASAVDDVPALQPNAIHSILNHASQKGDHIRIIAELGATPRGGKTYRPIFLKNAERLLGIRVILAAGAADRIATAPALADLAVRDHRIIIAAYGRYSTSERLLSLQEAVPLPTTRAFLPLWLSAETDRARQSL